MAQTRAQRRAERLAGLQAGLQALLDRPAEQEVWLSATGPEGSHWCAPAVQLALETPSFRDGALTAVDKPLQTQEVVYLLVGQSGRFGGCHLLIIE